MKTYPFLYAYTLFECMEKEKRKPGQRSRTGETKGEIIKYALEHGGMFEGSVLKDFLEENCNVRRISTPFTTSPAKRLYPGLCCKNREYAF
jgi:CRISPR/Cas system-associated protein Csm6